MCQLLGMNCNTPTDIVFSFTGFSQRGGRTDRHSDGWGIAFFEGRGARLFIDHHPAFASPLADLIRRWPIKSLCTIAHIRRATVGAVQPENCHPFMRELWGQGWVFAHNGDLKNYAPPLDGRFRPVGSTDSEQAFCWLMQELAHSSDECLDAATLTARLQPLLARIASHGTFNMLLSNGQALWAYASTRLCYLVRQHPFAHARLADEDIELDFAELAAPGDRAAIIATEPLTLDEQWTPIAPGELMTFIDGVPHRLATADGAPQLIACAA